MILIDILSTVCTVFMYNYDLWNDYARYDKYSNKKGVKAGGRNDNNNDNNCVVETDV